MGVVYKARDTRLDRMVAIKFLSPRVSDSPLAHDRFLREARTISALNHPHIAVIHEIDQWEGETFLVFEHLPGGSLSSRPPRNLAQALEYALQLAEALGAAHRHGVIHRDVKPANVLFTGDDTLKLSDFGLARHATDPHLTAVGTTLGTPAYMAPEQFLGRDADARSDVYSLGVVVHELLTGKIPESGHVLAVPPHVRPVLERALEPEAARRYSNADEMAADLRTVIAGQSAMTQAATVTVEIPRRRRAQWALAFVIALAGLMASHTSLGHGARRQAGGPEQLAVLPFANAGGAAWQAFCDGLTETLSSTLTRLEKFQESVRVVPAGVVRGQGIATASDARRLLGAGLVVTGSVQPESNRVRLALRVVDTRTSRQVGADAASFAPEDLPALQDWAVARVTRMLDVTTRPEAWGVLDGYRTHEPGAYEFYVQGRGYLTHYDVPEDVANAVASFHKALQRDPSYTLAHSGMAEALWRTWRTTRDPQWLEQAATSALRARQLNPRLAPVHVILGRIESSRGRNQEALRSLRRALDLEPSNPDAYGALAATYQAMGNFTEAEAACRKVVELRPGEWSGYNNLAVLYSEQRRLPEAEKVFQEMIALAPENVIAFQNLGGLYLLMGRYTEAGAALERALALKPTAVAYSNLGTAYYYIGRFSDAATAMEKAVEQRPGDYVLWGNLGDAFQWVPGKQERALPAWSQAAALAKTQLSVNPADVQARSSLAVYEAHTGHRAAALAGIAQARHRAGTNPRVLFKSALVYELCGRRREALEALKSALDAGDSPENEQREPAFAALRQDPACSRILSKEICNESNPEAHEGPRATRAPGHRTRPAEPIPLPQPRPAGALLGPPSG